MGSVADDCKDSLWTIIPKDTDKLRLLFRNLLTLSYAVSFGFRTSNMDSSLFEIQFNVRASTNIYSGFRSLVEDMDVRFQTMLHPLR